MCEVSVATSKVQEGESTAGILQHNPIQSAILRDLIGVNSTDLPSITRTKTEPISHLSLRIRREKFGEPENDHKPACSPPTRRGGEGRRRGDLPRVLDLDPERPEPRTGHTAPSEIGYTSAMQSEWVNSDSRCILHFFFVQKVASTTCDGTGHVVNFWGA
ncbi:hypothetical protein BC826DRAFT_32565 [Russula brevipes]|nr:hypothetical protein BC826DRAFT_32565 [Russula brevipes]